MSYFLTKNFAIPYEEAVEKTRQALKAEGFGILTEIDVKATLKQKLDADFRNYIILGACNPPLAYQALQAEANIGLMLPCNVVVQDKEDGTTEISAIDPAVAMQAIDNPHLKSIAGKVRESLRRVLDSL